MTQQWIVLVTTKELGESEAYGPYRTLHRANDIVALLRNPYSVTYRDDDKFFISVMPLQRYGESR